MRGVIPPLPNTLSWHGAQLEKRKKSTRTTLLLLSLTGMTMVGS
jgi:hypothetical protein